MGRIRRQLTRELKHGWNAFRDAPQDSSYGGGYSQSPRSNRSPARYFSDRSFVGSIYNRLAVDFALIEFWHCKLNEDGVAVEIVADGLNRCFTLDSNIDQNAFAMKVDFAMTLFEQGTACVVPIDCDMDPLASSSYDIRDLRVGTVAAWHPRKITMMVYDDRENDDNGEPVNGGVVKQMTLPKDMVMVVENPFYTVMNEPNGLLQRLITKLGILDSIDEAAGSGKLDLILQLPYTVRGESRQTQAQSRRDDLRAQLKDDELGIGYIDISEKVIQLNRPIENKLLDQIEYLGNAVMSELGITREIMNGTASRDTINNYYDRTIEPIATTFALEAKRKFLTKTAVTQKHSIEYYRDPLKLIPIDELAEVADKLIRNAVLTANEFRPKIGYRPSSQPGADKLINPNMPTSDQPQATGADAAPPGDGGADPLDKVNSMLDGLIGDLGTGDASG
jgi:hypothetical protein